MIPVDSLRNRPCEKCNNLDPNCEGMIIAGRCHPGAGVKVWYRQKTHSLKIECKKCGLLVVELSLGWPTS